MWSRVGKIVATSTLVAALSTPVIAHAEGAFQTSLVGVRNGTQSRNWEIRSGSSSAPTTASLAGCTSQSLESARKLDLTLRKVHTAWPDEDLGSRSFTDCYHSVGYGNWGRQSSGKYHFDIHTWIWQRVSARTFNVTY